MKGEGLSTLGAILDAFDTDRLYRHKIVKMSLVRVRLPVRLELPRAA